METRKEFEQRLLEELLKEIRPNPLCNILMFASEYLRKTPRPHDIIIADILDKYSDKMSTRISEARE